MFWRKSVLLGLAVFSHTGRAKDTSVLPRLLSWIDEVSSNDDLVTWADPTWPPSRFFRDVANQHLELRTNAYSHRGVFVTSPTWNASSQVVVAVPPRCLMSPSSARDANRSEPLAAMLAAKDGDSDPLAVLVAHLMCELSKHNRSAEGSFWGPYLDSLPLGDSSSALDWPDDVLAGSPSLMQHVVALRNRRAAVKATVGTEVGLADLTFGCSGAGWRGDQSFDEAFREAYTLAVSRKAATLPLGLWQNSVDEEASGQEVSHEVMTPLLDLLNHRRGGGRYTLLHASQGAVLGVGMVAPEEGLAAGEELWHDYEAGWSADGGDEDGCGFELLAAYGFIHGAPPPKKTASSAVGWNRSACVLLPWVGAVRVSDATGLRQDGRVLQLCTGATPVASSSGVQLSTALRWEIEHDLRALEATQVTSTAAPERGECRGDGVACEVALAMGKEWERRTSLVKGVAEGEVAVLRALHEACAVESNPADEQDKILGTGKQTKKTTKMAAKKKQAKKRPR